MAALFAALAVGCASPEAAAPTWYPPEDLEPIDQGKDDGWTFQPNTLIADDIFIDVDYMTEEQVQEFLHVGPYATESFLATYVWEGEKASHWIKDAATQYSINPLVLLIRLQMEHSLVYKQNPSAFSLKTAMGCGCWDNDPGCTHGPHGFGNQIHCAAEVLRSHFDDVLEHGETITGWGVGLEKESSEGTAITPTNAATAVLYTYTPWVLEGQGGNWLFVNLYRKYERHFLRSHPNHRWIGGDCSDEQGCGFEDGRCKQIGETAPFCTKPCDLYCPDSDSYNVSATFCAELPLEDPEEAQGWCVSQCDRDVYTQNDGCKDGFICVEMPRFNMPDVTREVCIPQSL